MPSDPPVFYSADPGALEWLEYETDKTLRCIALWLRNSERPAPHGLPRWLSARIMNCRMSHRMEIFSIREDNTHLNGMGHDAWTPHRAMQSIPTYFGRVDVPPLDSWIPEPL
jgi:hypothetical protein